jgi:hypothetical protein
VTELLHPLSSAPPIILGRKGWLGEMAPSDKPRSLAAAQLASSFPAERKAASVFLPRESEFCPHGAQGSCDGPWPCQTVRLRSCSVLLLYEDFQFMDSRTYLVASCDSCLAPDREPRGTQTTSLSSFCPLLQIDHYRYRKCVMTSGPFPTPS